MVKIVVAVVTHKLSWMPDDDIYLPVYVGAGRQEKCCSDSTGDNISTRNRNWCELTGLYWVWKNQAADYLGLVHYRRYFSHGRGWGTKKKRILTGEQLNTILQNTDVILPKPRHYLIETNYSQYAHAHHAIDLDVTREIIAEKHKTYLSAYDAVMKRSWGHRFNMFIMRRDLADAYCDWLFQILFELEKRLDISDYSDYDARVFGFVGERLLDVWIEANAMRYVQLPYVFIGQQHWLKKGCRFIGRKIKGGIGEWKQRK